MMKHRLFLILALISFVMASCGAKKTGAVNLKNATTRQVIKHYQKAEPQFETLYARLRASYNDGQGSQSISVTMRMRKNDTIWLSARLAGLIPLAKMMITPDRVRFYNKINHRYFDGDFRLLSQWLGVKVDFQKVQSLLLGQVLYNLEKDDYKLEVSKHGYILTSVEERPIAQSFLINKHHFRLKAQQLNRNYTNQHVTITYPSYKEVNHFLFPKEIDIIVNEKGESTKINIDYRTLEINTPLSFPFNMPSGYKEIQIK